MPKTGQLRGPYKSGIARRLQVVTAAIDVFGEFGFAAGTVQRVADRVGVTPAAIDKLFGNKEGLLVAVLYHWGELTTEVIGPEARGMDLLDGFRRLMSYHVQHRGLLDLYITMAAEATSPKHPAHEFMTDRYRRTLETMRGVFRDAVEQGAFAPMSEDEIAREAEWLLATMDGLEIQFLLDPTFDLERSFGHFLDSLTARLAAAEPAVTDR
ncbi:TetR/AcrR family transcriptional regulator [Naasia sp. SYSU D00057]|uniref:TetR/AcrR family transcriptional regulator n=1 Tax=Naasia sp. SYSU D00057 TaxID=2817380 RepID=UPI001B30A42C|nr:TetR/AcrR family transcriptional regulator [Naasia sp. SYSU D00057]